MNLSRIYLTGLAIAGIIIGSSSIAQAGIKDRVSFTVPAKVIMSEIASKPGQKKFLIASNTAFDISAENIIGTMNVKVVSSGSFEGLNFGSAAQMPGHAQKCKNLTSFLPSIIYRSNRKTALRRGDIKSQSVLVTLNFDAFADPEISIKASSLLPGVVPLHGPSC